MTEDKNNPLLTPEQVFSVLEFANGLTQGINGLQGVSGLFTPYLLNQNLTALNNNPKMPNYDQVIKALNEAVAQADNLQAYTEWMQFVDMIFKRTLLYYANLLSFDLTITCTNANSEDYNKTTYKKDRQIINDFLDKFDYKAEFHKMIMQMLRTETAYTWLRNNDDEKNMQYTLQIMPQKYCLLTGYWEKGLLYDFDMNFFLQSGVDIREYDPEFSRIMKNTFKGDGIDKYIPTNSFDNRRGQFAYWTQLSPMYDDNKYPRGAWAFKFDMGNFNQVPFLSGLIKDTMLNLPIQKLQYDKDMASAFAMLMGEIEMLNSSEPNATAFSPQNLGMLMNIVKQAIGKYIAVGAVPARNVDLYQYEDKNTHMYTDQLQNSVATGAAGSRVIYSSDKMSQEEIRNAIITDYNVMKVLYPQFEHFLNFYANKLTTHYKFSFSFNGCSYPFEQQARQKAIMDLASVGIVLNDTAFASAFGIKPQDFSRMLAETKADGSWIKNLSQLLSIHTQSGGSGSGATTDGVIHTGRVGRPRKADTSSESRDYDTSN